MANQTGIAINIKAWLPTGKTLDELLSALTIVKTAHESGDYAPLLAAASIEAVSTESKTRRMEDKPGNPTQAEPSSEPTGSTAPLGGQTAAGSSADKEARETLKPLLETASEAGGNTAAEGTASEAGVPDMSKVRTAAQGRAERKGKAA